LLKLKKHFEEKPDIVFVDIILDDSKQNWLKYLETNKPAGKQLRSDNAAKTRELFNISGIPEHIVVNKDGFYRKVSGIRSAYSLLSNQEAINDFINRKETNINIEVKFVRISNDETKTFIEIKDINRSEFFFLSE